MVNTNIWNSNTVFGVMHILNQTDFEFVCFLQMWSEVLITIDFTLKAKDILLDLAAKLVEGLTKA